MPPGNPVVKVLSPLERMQYFDDMTNATTVARALSVVRLSNLRDDSTSPERQREHNRQTAERKNLIIAGEAADIDISATKYRPQDRPQLGPWLKAITPSCEQGHCGHTEETPCMGQYSTVIFWRLDRFVRSVADFSQMIQWCEDHGKGLVSATEPFDLNDPSGFGRAMAQIIAVFAELEARTVRARVLDGMRKVKAEGRWAGGPPPFGYVSAPREGGGRKLVVDPVTQGFALEAAERVIGGESIVSVAYDFNRREIPTNLDRVAIAGGKKPEKRRQWDQSGLSRILHNPACMGIQVTGRTKKEHKVVRDENGRPKQVAEPLMSEEMWDELQRALDKRSVTRSRTVTSSPLLGVLYCGQCGRALYHRLQTSSAGKNHRYYVCAGRNGVARACPGTYFKADEVEDFIRDQLLEYRLNKEPALHTDMTEEERIAAAAADPVLGDSEVQHRVFIAGQNNDHEIAEIERAIRELMDDRQAGLFSSPVAQAQYRSQMSALEADYERLSALPSIPDEWRWEGAGETYRELWKRLDTEGRRQLLVDSGIRADIRPLKWSVTVPDDLVERVRQTR